MPARGSLELALPSVMGAGLTVRGGRGQDHGCGRLQKLIGHRSRRVANLIDRSTDGSFMTRRPVRSTQMKRS